MGYMWDKINQVKSFSKQKISTFVLGNRTLSRLNSKKAFLKKQAKAGLRDTRSRFKAYTSALAVFTLAFAISFLAASTFCTPHSTSAEGNEDTSTATAGDYSLTVSATKGVSLPLSVSENDTMTVSEGFVSVKTNSPGYKLYISMTGDSTNLTNVKDHLSGAIVATTGTVGDPTALTRGTWGYAIPSGTAHLVSDSKFNDSYSTTTSTSPDETKKFATPPSGDSAPSLLATSTSSTSESGDSYPVYYAIRANANTAPGEYSNSIAYTAVADAGSSEAMTITPSTIEPDTATTIEVATTMYSTASSLDATITMTNTTTPSTPTTLSCTKTSSAPLAYSCDVPASNDGTYSVALSLDGYAITYTGDLTVEMPTPTTMQEMTTTYCLKMDIGDALTLTDSRDNNSYTVKKLKDGNCWMTQNLRLVGSSDITVKPADSDVSSDFILKAPTSGSWCTTNTAECLNQSYVIDSNGVYYNWYTVTAGTGTYETTSGSATSSICPKGWRLPTGGSSGEFQTLYGFYNSYKLMTDSDGPAFVMTGYYRGSSFYNKANRGYYWSNMANDGNKAYYLLLTLNPSTGGGTVTPSGSIAKGSGHAARCIAYYYNTLKIDAVGGIWDGSNKVRFLGKPEGETETIPDPTIPSSAFNANGQGATYTPVATFAGWTLSGSGNGSLSGNNYTFGRSNTTNTLTASYILPTITKPGYTCRWSLNADGTGTYYDSGAHITNADATFYAICGKEFSIANMQQMTTDICDETIVGASKTLTDTRDGKTYTVRKLKDGNCWMTQNLRLQNVTISDSDSNLPSGMTVNIPASSTSNWCTGFKAECTDQLMTLDATDTSISGQSSAQSDYGVYYNWYTATASYGKYPGGATRIDYDICPKGWRLPTGGDSGEFGILYNNYYNSSSEMISPDGPALIYSGRRYGSSTSYQGTEGYYWTNTSSSNNGYTLWLRNGDVRPGKTNGIYYGQTVRCIAQ